MTSLAGGLGDDKYTFSDDWGTDLVMENANEGNDTISLEYVTSGSSFRFDRVGGITIPTILNGINQVLQDNYAVENFTGGNGNDTFTFGRYTSLSGVIRRLSGYGYAGLFRTHSSDQCEIDRYRHTGWLYGYGGQHWRLR